MTVYKSLFLLTVMNDKVTSMVVILSFITVITLAMCMALVRPLCVC